MGATDATMIGAGATIGAGIFVLLGIAASVADPLLSKPSNANQVFSIIVLDTVIIFAIYDKWLDFP